MVKWIKEQPYFNASTKRSCGSNGLDEMAMKMVVQMVNLNQVKFRTEPILMVRVTYLLDHDSLNLILKEKKRFADIRIQNDKITSQTTLVIEARAQYSEFRGQ